MATYAAFLQYVVDRCGHDAADQAAGILSRIAAGHEALECSSDFRQRRVTQLVRLGLVGADGG